MYTWWMYLFLARERESERNPELKQETSQLLRSLQTYLELDEPSTMVAMFRFNVSRSYDKLLL
jgi:hypothetical protein